MTPRGLAPRLRGTCVAAILVAEAAQAGVWGMDPVVGFTGDRATNPELTAASATGETDAAVLLDAPTTYTADAYRFSLMPSFRLGDARGYSSVTSDYEHLTARGEFDTERSTLTASLGAARDSSLYNDYLSDGAAGVRRDSASADVMYDRYLTEKLEFNLDANASRVRYGERAGAATLVDYKYVSLAPTLAWNTVERNKFTLTTGVSRYDSLDGTTESRNGNIQLGFVRKLTEQWTLNASGGYSRALNRIFFDQEVLIFTASGPVIEIIPEKAETAQNGTIYAVNLSHQGQLLLLTATASSQVQPIGFAFLSRQKSYELKATYTLSPRWSLTADAREMVYQNPVSNVSSYEVKVPYLSAGASWQWTEHLTLSLTASHVRESVPAYLFNEQSQEFTLTLSRQFNHVSFQ